MSVRIEQLHSENVATKTKKRKCLKWSEGFTKVNTGTAFLSYTFMFVGSPEFFP